MVGILFCRQDSAHRVGKDRSHPLLDVFVLAPLGMPPVGDAFDGLRVLGVSRLCWVPVAGFGVSFEKPMFLSNSTSGRPHRAARRRMAAL